MRSCQCSNLYPAGPKKPSGHDYASITELAKAEGVNQSYACRMLRLTLLAPGIVTTILNRTQDSDVMLKQLLEPLPVRWDEQIAMLKIGDGAKGPLSNISR
jgi:hypothetical protein